MPAHVAQVAAQRYTLIQIADVTQPGPSSFRVELDLKNTM
jgi:hypothetical protein